MNLIFANNLPTGGSAINVEDVDKITFYSSGDQNAGDVYVVIEVEGSWYRSTRSYNSTTWTRHTLTFSSAAKEWYKMEFKPGKAAAPFGGRLDISGTDHPARALSGTINHIGFVIGPQKTDGTGKNQRFDEIRIVSRHLLPALDGDQRPGRVWTGNLASNTQWTRPGLPRSQLSTCDGEGSRGSSSPTGQARGGRGGVGRAGLATGLSLPRDKPAGGV